MDFGKPTDWLNLSLKAALTLALFSIVAIIWPEPWYRTSGFEKAKCLPWAYVTLMASICIAIVSAIFEFYIHPRTLERDEMIKAKVIRATEAENNRNRAEWDLNTKTKLSFHEARMAAGVKSREDAAKAEQDRIAGEILAEKQEAEQYRLLLEAEIKRLRRQRPYRENRVQDLARNKLSSDELLMVDEHLKNKKQALKWTFNLETLESLLEMGILINADPGEAGYVRKYLITDHAVGALSYSADDKNG